MSKAYDFYEGRINSALNYGKSGKGIIFLVSKCAERMEDCINNINSACASLEEAMDYLFDIAIGNY